jgi:hypothetical protein
MSQHVLRTFRALFRRHSIPVDLIVPDDGTIRVDLGGNWRRHWGREPLPALVQAVGTVTRGARDTGALLLTGTGVYIIGNAGVLRSLPQPATRRAVIAAGARRHGSSGEEATP